MKTNENQWKPMKTKDTQWKPMKPNDNHDNNDNY